MILRKQETYKVYICSTELFQNWCNHKTSSNILIRMSCRIQIDQIYYLHYDKEQGIFLQPPEVTEHQLQWR